jgi:hypothetical protein
MKYKVLVLATGLALAGFAVPVHAAPVSGDALQAKTPQHEALRLAATTKRRGGVSTTTTDIDGDGTADVVVKSPPKPKHKPVRRVRRHR